MSQNKVKITWKAIVAVALVMATLIAMSTAVSAGFVEFIFGEEYEVMATSSGHTHTSSCYTDVTVYVWCGGSGGNYDNVCSYGVLECPGQYHEDTWKELSCGQ